MTTGASLSDLAPAGKQIGATDATFQRVATTSSEITVWQMRLDLDSAEVMRYAELLSGDEKLRAGRLHFEHDRRRFIVARGRLRLLLGDYLGVTPTAIAFSYTSRGKPYLTDNSAGIYFNVAHSEERALYALSGTCRPGVDIECLKREVDCDALARRFFTRAEYAALQQLPAFQRKRAFLACWTRKEAVVKATGDGLSLALDQFEVTVEPDAEPRILAASTRRIADCRLYAADPREGYIAAVAGYWHRQSEELDTPQT